MLVFKICPLALWEETQATGVFPGMPIDRKDGYIHFSTAEQLSDTAQRYFSGQTNLVILTVDTARLGDALRFEPSSTGRRPDDFPHLYGPLSLSAILSATSFDVPE